VASSFKGKSIPWYLLLRIVCHRCHNPALYLATRELLRICSGRLGDQELGLWAECQFVDAIGDIAMLGPPDDQTFGDQYDAYAKFINDAVTVSIAKIPFFDEPDARTAWLLNLTGQRSACEIEIHGQVVNIRNAPEGILPGMSGSPMLGEDAMANISWFR
jgi:hypothetical protein